MSFQRQGILCVVSGPSGSGKTSLCRALSERGECVYSISCTTRRPREGEIDGEHYFFLSEEEFERRVAAGDFLEHARVHDRRYVLRRCLRERCSARMRQRPLLRRTRDLRPGRGLPGGNGTRGG